MTDEPTIFVPVVLTECRISPSKTIGGLSDRQRVELLAVLPNVRVRRG